MDKVSSINMRKFLSQQCILGVLVTLLGECMQNTHQGSIVDLALD